jgi:hypothetical protein
MGMVGVWKGEGMTIREQLADESPEILLLDEEKYDEAIVGIVYKTSGMVAVYDTIKIIEILNQEMSYEDAVDWYEVNIEGSYMGDQTPIYMTLLKDIL